MNSIAEMIVDTVLIGGRLVFLSERAPSELGLVLQKLASRPGAIPFLVIKSSKSVTEGHLQTRAEDLLMEFPQQAEIFAKCFDRMEGRRVVFGRGELCMESIASDQFWLPLFAELENPKKIEQIAESFTKGCLFLDRDDVVVKNVPYNKDRALVELLPGVADLIQRAHKKSLWVALVTNQSGLGRGWINWSEYQAVHQRMLALLAAEGAWIDECVWAGFYEKNGVQEGRLYENLRKPNPGMFQMVDRKLRVSFQASLMVGDSASDLIAAHKAKVGKLYLLSSDKVSDEEAKLEKFTVSQSDFKYQTIHNFTEIDL